MEHSERICEIFSSLDGNGNFRFPEIEKHYVNPNKIAIAISGGGTRSMVCMMGYFRALRKFNCDFLKEVSYISSVSGGSWFTSILAFAQEEMEEIIGSSIEPQNFTHYSLYNHNYEKKNRFMGDIISNCPIIGQVLNSFLSGVNSRKIWDHAVGELFLKFYSINDKVPVFTEIDKKLNEKFNGINCIVKKENFPFFIFLAGLLDDDLLKDSSPSIEFTPMYFGCRVPTDNFGGLLISNQGYSADYKKLNTLKDHVDTLYVSKKESNCTIETMIGASSAAFVPEILKSESSGSTLGAIASGLNPKLKIWGMMSNQSHEIDLCDGAMHDNTGITPLVARGCKKIISFLNTPNFRDNYCNFGVSHLFGLESELRCMDYNLRTKFQIFSLEDWIELRKNIDNKLENSETDLFYHRVKLNVLKNWDAGVNGGYEVEILFVSLFPCKRYLDLLSINIEEIIELKNFPNVDFLFGDNGKLLELNPSQVNLTSSYCDWVLTEIIKEIPDFFEDIA